MNWIFENWATLIEVSLLSWDIKEINFSRKGDENGDWKNNTILMKYKVSKDQQFEGKQYQYI
jgi:hypothetical protein